MCLYPKQMINRRYVKTKKNGGVIPPLDDYRKMYVAVGCGECMECRKKKANEWQVRLKEEMRCNSQKAYFMTWTFDDQSLNDLKKIVRDEGIMYDGWKLENEVCRLAMRRYLERWRKQYGKSLRHWCVTEKGQTSTERIHMHGIVWTDKDKEDIVLKWKYGFCDIGKKGVGEESAGYLVKYMHKVDERHRDFKSKVFTSAGMGAGYLDRYDSKIGKKNEQYVDRSGKKLALPQYFRQKLYDDDEREELWMQKLDEQRRFVLGVEVDVSTEEGEEDYVKLRAAARMKNKRYGYGSGSVDWDKRRYKSNLKRKQDESNRDEDERND